MSALKFSMKQLLIKGAIIFVVLFAIIGLGRTISTGPLEKNEEYAKKEESSDIIADSIETVEKTSKEIVNMASKDIEEKTSEVQKDSLFYSENKEEIKEESLNIEDIEDVNAEVIKNGHIVAIDAGHQQKQNTDKEPIGPGAIETKQKVSSGTQGVNSKLPEYELTLDIALRLKEALINEGYEVIMIRETNNVDISNAERAEIANNSNAEIFLRLHADGSEDSNVKGVSTLCPTENNEYCAFIANDSYSLSKSLVDNLSKETGDTNKGVSRVDNMTGINWCKIPVSIVEMGFMTNPETDSLFQTEEYKDKIVKGLVEGVNEYFGGL